MKNSQKWKEVLKIIVSLIVMIALLVLIAIICGYINAHMAIMGTSYLIMLLVILCAVIAMLMLFPAAMIINSFAKLFKK